MRRNNYCNSLLLTKGLAGVFFWLFLSFPLFAQKNIQVGVKGGGQLASSYIEHTLYTILLKSRPIQRAHVGVVARMWDEQPKKGLKTGIQTGVYYMQKGWQQSFVDTNLPSAITKLDYLSLPISSIIYASKGSSRIYVEIGFFLDFLLSSQTLNLPNESQLNTDLEDFFTYDPTRDRTFGYGGKVGGGYQLKLGRNSVFVEGGFQYAISDFIRIDSRADALPDLSNLYEVSLSIGYLFSLK